MIHRLSDKVWWGNYESPQELPEVRAIINVAHSFSARRGRNVYWANLEKVNWQTLYFRLAKKDGQAVDPLYMQALVNCVNTVNMLGAFPLLCHCQMGGHRGPTVAMFAHFVLSGFNQDALDEAIARIKEVRPGFGQGRNNTFHVSLVEWCRDWLNPREALDP